MKGAPREEKVIIVSATYGLLLAHYEEKHSRICEEMPQLPSTGQLDSHSPTEVSSQDH